VNLGLAPAQAALSAVLPPATFPRPRSFLVGRQPACPAGADAHAGHQLRVWRQPGPRDLGSSMTLYRRHAPFDFPPPLHVPASTAPGRRPPCRSPARPLGRVACTPRSARSADGSTHLDTAHAAVRPRARPRRIGLSRRPGADLPGSDQRLSQASPAVRPKPVEDRQGLRHPRGGGGFLTSSDCPRWPRPAVGAAPFRANPYRRRRRSSRRMTCAPSSVPLSRRFAEGAASHRAPTWCRPGWGRPTCCHFASGSWTARARGMFTASTQPGGSTTEPLKLSAVPAAAPGRGMTPGPGWSLLRL